jgi:glycerophosphoryl diester phosphodiesterase
MVAFSAAVELGYKYLETDVHLTADGVLVLFHDDDLSPVSDRKGIVAGLPYSEVRRARVGGEPIALLADLLGEWPEARINIDAKHDRCVPALLEALDRAGAHDRVCVGSFCNRRAHRLRRLTDGRICTWMGRGEILRLRLAGLTGRIPGLTGRIPGLTGRIPGLTGRIPGRFAPCAQVPIRQGLFPLVDPTFVGGAQNRGVAVQVWTINDAEEMGRLIDMGVHDRAERRARRAGIVDRGQRRLTGALASIGRAAGGGGAGQVGEGRFRRGMPGGVKTGA